MTRGSIIDQIQSDIHDGFGVMPVIGSGMSAASGIPAGAEYQAYLFHCLRRAFDRDNPWNPRSLRWPALEEEVFDDGTKGMDPDAARWTWSRDQIRSIGESPTSERLREHAALWQALGVVSDWRATLHLLSRIEVALQPSHEIKLREPDARVIDSFFVNLTRGKRPNTSHLLLAHLADVLRIKVILTTNFDELLEAAFQRFDMPIATFDVHYEAGFPDARLVRAQRSIVKINGGRYGLRADFTLDKLPNPSDIENFISYLTIFHAGRTSLDSRAPRPVREAQRNLLVMGVSGRERRTIALLCHALRACEGLKVYWICHRQGDVTRVRAEFRQMLESLEVTHGGPTMTEVVEKSLFVEARPDLGLFLLTLYQQMFRCLPPGGVPFSATWPIPPPPYAGMRDYAPLTKESDRLTAAIARLVSSADKEARGASLFVYGESGVPSAAAKSFMQLRETVRCVWLDLEEQFDPADFALMILEALAREAGMVELLPMQINRAHFTERVPPALTEQLRRVARLSTRPFVIFINGRDCPGQPGPQGRMSWCWSEAEISAFSKIVDCLAECPHLTTVVLGWQTGALAPRALRLPPAGTKCEPPVSATRPAVDDEGCHSVQGILRQGPERAAENVLQRLTDPEARKFLFALTLFKKSRYPSALNTRAVAGRLQSIPGGPDAGPAAPQGAALATTNDRDQIRAARVKEWLSELRMADAIRDGDHEPVAMHHTVCKTLAASLREENAELTAEEPRIRQGIADWYTALYLSSGDVHAALESIEQRVDSLSCALRQSGPEGSRADYFALTAATQIFVSFKLIEPAIRSTARPQALARVFRRLEKRLKMLISEVHDHYGGQPSSLASAVQNKLQAASSLRRELSRHLKDVVPPDVIPSKTKDSDHAPVASELEGPETARPAPLSVSPPSKRVRGRGLRKAEVQARYRRIKHWANQRDYSRAESSLIETLGVLLEGFDIETLRRSPDAFKTIKGYCPKRVSQAIPLLRRLQLIELYRAEALRCLMQHPSTADHTKLELAQHRAKRQAYAEAVYRFTADHLRYVEDIEILQRENAFIRANTGIMLSGQGRYTEAHRKYNEAYSYLNRLAGLSLPLRFATVDIRRAESFLHHLEELRRRGETSDASGRKMQRFGLVYDALGSVDRAAYKARGVSVSTVWASWLYELELRVCFELIEESKTWARSKEYSQDVQDLFARCRDGRSLGEWFGATLKNAFFVAGDDLFRCARYVDLAQRFLSTADGVFAIGQWGRDKIERELRIGSEQLERSLSDDAELDSTVLAYARQVVDTFRVP